MDGGGFVGFMFYFSACMSRLKNRRTSCQIRLFWKFRSILLFEIPIHKIVSSFLLSSLGFEFPM